MFATSADCQTEIGTRLEGDQEFDFVIISAGFIGLSLAHRLIERQPQAKIAVIDALRVGEGTSGRNAGFIIDVPHNVDGGKASPEHDGSLFRLNNFASNLLRNFKDRYAICCDWQDAGKYIVAHERRNLDRLNHFRSRLEDDGLDFEDIGANELKKTTWHLLLPARYLYAGKRSGKPCRTHPRHCQRSAKIGKPI